MKFKAFWLTAILGTTILSGNVDATVLTAADISDPTTQFFDPDNGHIYQYVSGGFDWLAAKADAEATSLGGVNGYLATVTSASEQGFIWSHLPSSPAPAYWLGANDATALGDWRWVTGPEAGLQFWSGGGAGAAIAGAYNNWDSGALPPQPNSADNEPLEVYLELQVNLPWNNLTAGKWGDDHVSGNNNGYIIEFSGDSLTAIPEPSIWLTVSFCGAVLIRIRQKQIP